LKAPTLYLLSLGCPKNLIDAEVMAASLEAAGFVLSDTPEKARVILVNTCAFILPAREESIDEILSHARFKEPGVGVCECLVVAGCLPQRYGPELARELPEVDLFLGIDDVPSLPRLLGRARTGGFVPAPDPARSPRFLMTARHKRHLLTPPFTAYLKIAEGCSNRCAYCVIPEIRGPLRSRLPDDILAEAEGLVRCGVRELILVAQDTTAYGLDLRVRPSLEGLLADLASLPGLQWIRLLYTYPDRLTEPLFRVIARTPKVCPYIDMPIQHGDDAVLTAMGRRGGRQGIVRTVRVARDLIPQVALRTSVIVGFPGETPRRFENLLDLIRELRFDHLGAFVYSREKGTPAAEKAARISETEKTRRRNRAMEEQALISWEIQQGLLGSRQEVLVEGASDIPEYPYVGRCRRQAPEIDGLTYLKGSGLTPGDMVACRITAAEEYDLFAEALSPYPPAPTSQRG
jgi:ribosomal protein S12 methylthiotransferase